MASLRLRLLVIQGLTGAGIDTSGVDYREICWKYRCMSNTWNSCMLWRKLMLTTVVSTLEVLSRIFCFRLLFIVILNRHETPIKFDCYKTHNMNTTYFLRNLLTNISQKFAQLIRLNCQHQCYRCSKKWRTKFHTLCSMRSDPCRLIDSCLHPRVLHCSAVQFNH